MSVWVTHQEIKPADELEIFGREVIFLPFSNLPDLSHVSSQNECRALLQKLHPEKPPETIMLMMDRIWQQFSMIAIDDTVAVPLPDSKMVALGRISGKYKYRVGTDGDDEHMVPVEWYPKLIPISSFGKFKSIFNKSNQSMIEISDRETKIKILDQLPHKYNRFAKLKWILVIFFALGALNFIVGMLRQ